MKSFSVGSKLGKMSKLFKMTNHLAGPDLYRYRGDGRDANLLFNSGFTPNGSNTSIESHLVASNNSYYVSMTYSLTQAVKYGGLLQTTIYAVQPSIVTNIQLSRLPKLSQYQFLPSNRNLFTVFENEIAACGAVPAKHIYAAQKLYGCGLCHFLEPIQYNKNFIPSTYELMIPSANAIEANEIESYFLKTNIFPELHQGQRFIRMHEATKMSEALSSQSADFNVTNALNMERRIIRTVSSCASENQIVSEVLRTHHEYMITYYSRKNTPYFFNHSTKNKTDILDGIPTEKTSLKTLP